MNARVLGFGAPLFYIYNERGGRTTGHFLDGHREVMDNGLFCTVSKDGSMTTSGPLRHGLGFCGWERAGEERDHVA